MRDDVKKVTILLVRPHGEDMGAVEEGFYIVQRGEVTLTDAAGGPLARASPIRRKKITWSRKVAKDEDAHRVAKQLLWALHKMAKSSTKFDRPIYYKPMGFV
jgi:hypothetical protein